MASCTGFDRLYADIEMMLGNKPSFIWKILWGLITPCLILVSGDLHQLNTCMLSPERQETCESSCPISIFFNILISDNNDLQQFPTKTSKIW